MPARPAVWVLLGKRTGDNNQVLALAAALGLPFREIRLSYNALHRIPPSLLGRSTASLTPDARQKLHAPCPDLVIGIGSRSVPAALAIRQRSGGKSRLVRLGNPRADPAHFDLVITTPQYAVPDAANVIRLPLPLGSDGDEQPAADEAAWFSARPKPHRLLVIGGPSFMWRLERHQISKAARELCAKADSDGGTVIGVPSPRTPRLVRDAARRELNSMGQTFVDGSFPRYRALLADADEIYVTGDSVSMLSEAIGTGKPVGLIAPRRTFAGKLLYWWANLTGTRVPVRDLTCVWGELEAGGLIGSIAEPVKGFVGRDRLDLAVNAVRKLID